ncbi:MAG: phosphatidylserine decarboxylase family protein [Deltaproteobacteria bacterium]|nr:phosphatidylserine decarboxylase family protein [Deltaproteobacteria bacterium]
MCFAPAGHSRILGLAGASLLLNILGFPTIGFLLFLVTLFVAYFFRDPERYAPEEDNCLVAPADGKVVTVEKHFHDARFLSAPVTRIGIFMSPLDVHVNRAPIAGRVTNVQYHPGQFRPAFAAAATEVNEQNAVTIQDDKGRRVVMVQVAGILARRIVCALKGGERVQRGDRYGMIMLGSRVDVYCSPEIALRVQVGQRVKAGETVIGTYS